MILRQINRVYVSTPSGFPKIASPAFEPTDMENRQDEINCILAGQNENKLRATLKIYVGWVKLRYTLCHFVLRFQFCPTFQRCGLLYAHSPAHYV